MTAECLLDAEALRAQLRTRWLGRDLTYLESATSTNDELAARARAGARHGAVVIAETQTQGRGRQGRTWHSPPGQNLYLSALLRLGLPPASTPPVTLAAGVGVCDAIIEAGLPASIKWPNDVYIEGRKVAGILTETSTRENKIEAIVLGVGVNVNQSLFPEELVETATSLRLAGGGEPRDREAFCALLLLQLERWIDKFCAAGAGPVAHAWKARTHIFGHRLRVTVDGKTVEGWARDMDDMGALWLEDDNKRMWKVLSGEVVEAR